MQKQGSLGQWLKQRCKQERLSLRQAAARVDLSHATIADIIKGERPSLETIKKLAQGFGGDGALQDYLLLLAGYRTPRPEEPTGALAELVDKLRQFDDRQVEMMIRFADLLIEIGEKD